MPSPEFTLFVVLVILGVVGCGTDSPQNESNAQPVVVTVVGDKTASTVIDKLAEYGIRSIPTLKQQSDSSLIVVVQDSTVGPLPVHLEIAKAIGKRPAEEYIWLFTNTSLVDDQELLELEELECREIFNSQQLPGDHVLFAFDSRTAPVSADYRCPRGWEAIARHIQKVGR